MDASGVQPSAKESPDPGQAAHRNDSDTAQTDGAPTKSIDSVQVPVSIAVVQAASHGNVTVSSANAAGDAARVLDARGAAAGDSVPSAGINASQLIQTMSSASMHVGMRSADFGDISIRTQVSQQQVLTQISVEHGDLGKAITEHLPGVQAKLVDNFGLRASIEVHSSGMSFSGERGYASQQDRRPHTTRGAPVMERLVAEMERVPHGSSAIAGDGYRLDIRA
jgi:hypothetical protein